MIESGRRVRTLKLRVPDRGALNRGQHLVGEALSAASLPGIPARGLYLVRRLDLGTFQAGSSPLALARRIDRLVTAAVALGDGGARPPAVSDLPDAEAVWFEDPVAPLVALAGAIARGEVPRAWYWRVAVPDWFPGTDAGTALRQLMHTAHLSTSGAFAAARVLQRLLDDGREDSLLSVLTVGDASTLLDGADWRPRGRISRASGGQGGGVPGVDQASAESLRSEWRAALARWLVAWPEGDTRAEWLSRLALVRVNPARATVRAGAPVASALARALGLVTPARADSGSGSGPGPVQAPDPVPPPPGPGGPVARAVRRRRPAPPDFRADARPMPGAEGRAHGFPDRDASASERAGSPGTAARTGEAPAPAPLTAPMSAWGAEFSPNAGFILLVQVLRLVGMDAILAASPTLAEHNLPGRVLAALAGRVGLTDRDPAHALLGESPVPEPSGPISFVAPAAWSALLTTADPQTAPTVLGPGAGAGRRVLFEPRARLMLACWKGGDRPAGVSAWLRTPLLRQRGPRDDGIVAVCRAVQLAAGRYLRRHAGTTLRRLVARSGRVASTPTHLDVFFDDRLVDMRLRRSGVDFDPGWVPWLGRVVTVHYGRGADTPAD